MRWLVFLLLFPFTAHGALEISQCAAAEVISKLQPKFTRHPSGVAYGWIRYVSVPGTFSCGGGYQSVYPTALWGKQKTCYLAPLTNETDFINSVLPITQSEPGAVRTVTNPVNGLWFVTNATNIEQSQADMDWCTQ